MSGIDSRGGESKLPTSAGQEEVTVLVYDFVTEPKEGIAPGFYYDIPETHLEVGKAYEPKLVGPFVTHAKALAAAQDFIDEAIAGEEALDCSDEEIQIVKTEDQLDADGSDEEDAA